MKKSILYSLLIIFVSAIIINPNETMQAAKFGLDLCINTVVPSLLPFFILNHILIHTGFINAVCKVFDKTIRKIFNISANAVSSVVLGITSGYPLGAKTAVSLAEANEISEVEYERVIAFCNNAGPVHHRNRWRGHVRLKCLWLYPVSLPSDFGYPGRTPVSILQKTRFSEQQGLHECD